MADSGIKKVIIPKEKLGTILASNEYVVRYRVVSEDKNRSSYWSPNYIVLSNPINPSEGDVNITNNTISVTWEAQEYQAFDVFVGFNNLEPTWHASTATNTYQFIKSGVLPVRVVVQIKSIGNLNNGAFSKVLNSDLEIYDSGQVLV